MINFTGSVPHSDARAGVGLGLTAIHAPISGPESRAGVGEGLTSIHAPISSQLSTALSTSEFELPRTTAAVSEQDSQQSFEESKFYKSRSHHCHACLYTSLFPFFLRPCPRCPGS